MVNVYVKTTLLLSQTQLLFNVSLVQIVYAENVKSVDFHKHVMNAFKMPLMMLAHANVKISSINPDLNVSLVLLDALLAHLQDVPPVKQVQMQVVLLREIK